MGSTWSLSHSFLCFVEHVKTILAPWVSFGTGCGSPTPGPIAWYLTDPCTFDLWDPGRSVFKDFGLNRGASCNISTCLVVFQPSSLSS